MITEFPTNENTKIINFFYNKNEEIIEKLIHKYDIKRQNVLDIGGGSMSCFPLSTDIFDIAYRGENYNNINCHIVDIDFDKFPFLDKYFSFSYCRHTLEDIQNPQNAFNEIVRTSKCGYIETPSPLCEIIRGIDSFGNSDHRGYDHHRYFVYSDIEKNALYFLPKYPIIETIQYNQDEINKLTFLLNNNKYAWNNYYLFDSNNPPSIFVWRNGVNFSMKKDKEYTNLINQAIYKSIEYTNNFISKLEVEK
jgi:hypothetical protein